MPRPDPAPSSPLPPSNEAGCELFAERETAGAWEYDARLVGSDGSRRSVVLVLSWSDYQMWVPDGGLAPSRVAHAALRFIASHPDRFGGAERIDVSSARRRVPGADEAILRMLQGD